MSRRKFLLRVDSPPLTINGFWMNIMNVAEHLLNPLAFGESEGGRGRLWGKIWTSRGPQLRHVEAICPMMPQCHGDTFSGGHALHQEPWRRWARVEINARPIRGHLGGIKPGSSIYPSWMEMCQRADFCKHLSGGIRRIRPFFLI